MILVQFLMPFFLYTLSTYTNITIIGNVHRWYVSFACSHFFFYKMICRNRRALALKETKGAFRIEVITLESRKKKKGGE